MNRVTLELARAMYDAWYDDVLCYAPPGISTIASFEEQRQHFMDKARREKKTLAYRRGNSDWSPDTGGSE